MLHEEGSASRLDRAQTSLDEKSENDTDTSDERTTAESSCRLVGHKDVEPANRNAAATPTRMMSVTFYPLPSIRAQHLLKARSGEKLTS